MASASDVPNKFDVVINGQGYLYAPSDQGLPPSIFGLKVKHGFTPTFIQRSNTSGDFGDNTQDFWMTATQRDWEIGEQQRYFRQSDADSVRRYWQGSGVDVRIPGQVSMRAGTSTVTFGGSIICVSPRYLIANAVALVGASSTNLYSVAEDGTVTDRSAHGLGAAPALWGITTDGANVYLSTTAAGTVGVRKWTGGAYSTFSASGASALAFLNNTLYGLRDASGDLVRWDTAGVLTSISTWKDATGVAGNLANSKLIPFGGKLAILKIPAATVPSGGPVGSIPELWLYDGTAVSLSAQFPAGFVAYDIAQALGNIYVSGVMPLASGSGTATCPVIFEWSPSGSIAQLWRSFSSSTVPPTMISWGNGLLFTDASRSALMFYDAGVGGVQTISTSWPSSGNPALGATGAVALTVNSTVTGYFFQDSGTRPSSATLTTSLFDFDNSLSKLFRGIKVEFDSATDGNGGSVDIAYRVGDVDGSYTNLLTGAMSGTEYTLSNITGNRISVKVTLNKGTSTNGPILKRIKVRAAPVQESFANVQYVLYLGGETRFDPQEGSPIQLRDGTIHTKDGAAMAADLVTAAKSTTPITVTDSVNGTYTGVIDQSNFELSQIRPREFIAVVGVRQV